MLRILYSQSEEDLLKHGYTPEQLKSVGSVIDIEREAHVVRTIIGIVAVVLQSYGTDLSNDLNFLKFSIVQTPRSDNPTVGIRRNSPQNALALSAYLSQSTTEIVRVDVSRMLRNLFSVPNSADLDETLNELKNIEYSQREKIKSVKEELARRQEQINNGGDGNDGEFSNTVGSTSYLEAVKKRNIKVVFLNEEKVFDLNFHTVEDSNASDSDTISESESVVETTDNTDDNSDDSDKELEDALAGSGGSRLPVNIRELYRYRIRRKKMLGDLILNLGKLHKLLEKESSEILDLTRIIANSGIKTGKYVTIKDILGELKRKQPRNDVFEVASTLSSKWNDKGANL